MAEFVSALRRLAWVLVMVCGVSASAAADSISYYLNLTNTSGVPSSTPPFAQVTLQTVTSGSGQVGVQLTVTSLISGFVIDEFGFNVRTDGGVIGLAAVPGLSSGGQMDGFGSFDYIFSTAQPGLASFSFTVFASDGSVNLALSNLAFGSTVPGGSSQPWVFFAAHIKPAGGGSSAFIGGSTVVPEPASVLLLGSGFLALGRYLRRKKGRTREGSSNLEVS